MKKTETLFRIIFVLCLALTGPELLPQSGGPPEPPDSHGNTGDQEAGGNASIKGGLFILLALGSVYAGKKVFHKNRAPDS
jgi:hypothetical protein